MKKVTLFTVILALVVSCANSKKDSTAPEVSQQEQAVSTTVDDRGYIVKVGQMAPDFKMQLTDGTWMELSKLRGKLVMLQFTASWCGVCIKEMPHIEKDIWLKHKNNPNFALFGIDREEPLATVEQFIKKTGVTYPMGLDPKADIFASYADRKAGITRNVIINAQGEIIMLTRLYNEQEFNTMVNLIDQELAKMAK